MKEVLEIQFKGWTATPRLPFILSGNAVCMATPSYSTILGIIGCCLGRIVTNDEVEIGFYYRYDSIGYDIETRQRLVFDGGKVKKHHKGTDAYSREFHVLPTNEISPTDENICLILWLNRTDWENYFKNPIGTPSLGRSQDLLCIQSVKTVKIKPIKEGNISGCLIPFTANLKIGGQLVQLADAYQENEEIGSGRRATKSKIFMSVPFDNKSNIQFSNLYETIGDNSKQFYLHNWE